MQTNQTTISQTIINQATINQTTITQATINQTAPQAQAETKQEMRAGKESAVWEEFEFRQIRQEEADLAAELERVCFPPNEACSEAQMKERVKLAPEVFLVAIEQKTGVMAGFLNGIATDEETFRDGFFEDAGLHRRSGKNIMLLGLDVLPQFRGRGLAREIVRRYRERERARNRSRLILTCLEGKVQMYEKMGFVDLGIANSSWGGEEWHAMSCELR